MPKQQSNVEVFSDEEEEDKDNEISFEDEKKKSLAILEQITASQSSTSKSKLNDSHSNSNQTEQHTNGDSQSKEATLTTHSKRTYEFDQTKLKSVFNKTSANTATETGQFQFQFFNNAERISLPVPKISSVPYRPMSNGTSRMSASRSNNTLDSEDNHRKPSLPTQMKKNDQPIDGTFFFFDIDDRLKEGLEHFVRTEDLNELERTWPTKRKEIGEALRAKHRKAIQRKDKHRVFNHRRQQKQQQQHSTSNSISKSEIE